MAFDPSFLPHGGYGADAATASAARVDHRRTEPLETDLAQGHVRRWVDAGGGGLPQVRAISWREQLRDPRYLFVRAVAGYTNEPVQEYVEDDSFAMEHLAALRQYREWEALESVLAQEEEFLRHVPGVQVVLAAEEAAPPPAGAAAPGAGPPRGNNQKITLTNGVARRTRSVVYNGTNAGVLIVYDALWGVIEQARDSVGGEDDDPKRVAELRALYAPDHKQVEKVREAAKAGSMDPAALRQAVAAYQKEFEKWNPTAQFGSDLNYWRHRILYNVALKVVEVADEDVRAAVRAFVHTQEDYLGKVRRDRRKARQKLEQIERSGKTVNNNDDGGDNTPANADATARRARTRYDWDADAGPGRKKLFVTNEVLLTPIFHTALMDAHSALRDRLRGAGASDTVAAPSLDTLMNDQSYRTLFAHLVSRNILIARVMNPHAIYKKNVEYPRLAAQHNMCLRRLVASIRGGGRPAGPGNVRRRPVDTLFGYDDATPVLF